MKQRMPVKYYRVKIETPHSIQQYVATTWAGLSKEMFVEAEMDKWKGFGRHHDCEVKVQIDEITYEEVAKTRSYLRHRKVN